jgi:hypothetical protein
VYFGLTSLSRFSFVGVGFWVVMCAGVGLGLVYAVGSAKGKRAAQMWTDACLVLLAAGGIADILWALMSGQWRAFMLQFGFSPLAEMMVLAALLLGTMWFMAVRYTSGLDE